MIQANKIYTVVSVEDDLPEFSEDILISYDGGQTFPESAAFREHRKCMLAGVGGGNGYFGQGFCSNGSTGCDNGLILSDVTHWLKELNKENKVFSEDDIRDCWESSKLINYGNVEEWMEERFKFEQTKAQTLANEILVAGLNEILSTVLKYNEAIGETHVGNHCYNIARETLAK